MAIDATIKMGFHRGSNWRYTSPPESIVRESIENSMSSNPDVASWY
jgi:hypothetical protein